MAKLNGLEHHVHDYDKEVDFFKNVLGAKLNRESPGRSASFQLADNFNIVVLPQDPSHPGYSGFRGETICLEVPEVDQLSQQLKSKGVKLRVEPGDQRFGVRNFFFETPGGLTLGYQTPFPGGR